MTDLDYDCRNDKRKIYVELDVSRLRFEFDEIVVRLKYQDFDSKYVLTATSKKKFSVKGMLAVCSSAGEIPVYSGNVSELKKSKNGYAFVPFKEGLDAVLKSMSTQGAIIEYDRGIQQAQKLIYFFENMYEIVSHYAEKYDKFMKKEFDVSNEALMKSAQYLNEDERALLLQVGCHIVQGVSKGFDEMRKGFDRKLFEDKIYREFQNE